MFSGHLENTGLGNKGTGSSCQYMYEENYSFKNFFSINIPTYIFHQDVVREEGEKARRREGIFLPTLPEPGL